MHAGVGQRLIVIVIVIVAGLSEKEMRIFQYTTQFNLALKRPSTVLKQPRVAGD